MRMSDWSSDVCSSDLTIGTAAEAEGRHKKQSGGHGQFAVATVRLEPLERGGGFEFVDKIVGGAISRTYIPAVAKGIEEAMARGGVNGYPVIDRSEEHTSELQSLMRISYAAFCLKKKKTNKKTTMYNTKTNTHTSNPYDTNKSTINHQRYQHTLTWTIDYCTTLSQTCTH